LPSVGLVFAVIVGIIAGLAATLLTNLLYKVEDLFQKLPIHWMWWPAIGGLIVGTGGYFEPRSLGVGYDVIHGLLLGQIIGSVIIGLLLAKAIIWLVALSSGTSGGILAPLLMMGAMLGALEAHMIPLGDSGLWAMVSMAALMGGTMRSPFTAAIFAMELTHDFNVFPEVFAGCIAAQTVTVLLLKRSMLTEKVARRGYHISREYSVDPFETLRVGEVMDTKITTLDPETTVADFAHAIAERDPGLTRHHAVPIVDQHHRLVGIITRGDVVRALEDHQGGRRTVLDAGSSAPIVCYPDQLVQEAIAKMLHQKVGRLIVVARDDPGQMIGYLGRPDIIEARLHRLEEEHLRELGPGVSK
jgi:CIC family chloride channel protein